MNISQILSQKWYAELAIFFNFFFYLKGHWTQVFFSKFLMGGDSKFSVPVGPRRGRSRMGGGTCDKNLTEAKTAHLMQNKAIFCYSEHEIQLFKVLLS